MLMLQDMSDFFSLKSYYNTKNFKYGIVNFVYLVYVYQVIKSLERTGILFQNSLYIFKLLIIMFYVFYKSMMVHLYGETACSHRE